MGWRKPSVRGIVLLGMVCFCMDYWRIPPLGGGSCHVFRYPLFQYLYQATHPQSLMRRLLAECRRNRTYSNPLVDHSDGRDYLVTGSRPSPRLGLVTHVHSTHPYHLRYHNLPPAFHISLPHSRLNMPMTRIWWFLRIFFVMFHAFTSQIMLRYPLHLTPFHPTPS
ncbi:hypothetical protein EDB19DRAFT_1345772 [Suillus lakei]|nr:hypothetical protein EDB19DRAFT_1345772 [Suillus lakei]